jgi:hypothetical protein
MLRTQPRAGVATRPLSTPPGKETLWLRKMWKRSALHTRTGTAVVRNAAEGLVYTDTARGLNLNSRDKFREWTEATPRRRSLEPGLHKTSHQPQMRAPGASFAFKTLAMSETRASLRNSRPNHTEFETYRFPRTIQSMLKTARI